MKKSKPLNNKNDNNNNGVIIIIIIIIILRFMEEYVTEWVSKLKWKRRH